MILGGWTDSEAFISVEWTLNRETTHILCGRRVSTPDKNRYLFGSYLNQPTQFAFVSTVTVPDV